MKLSKAKVRMIKMWLKYSKDWKEDHCPFDDKPGFDLFISDNSILARFAQCYCRDVCKKTFPNVRLEPGNAYRAALCPCQVHTEAYVVHKARQIVKENKETLCTYERRDK